ncbi:hypothetical protein NUV89_18565 [Pseudomonas sp. 18.1.10]|uniref:hypothetical protein n=1 Tax=Pseudomonas sp. 18.1.10 TaxID=2969302 RepID=UPI00214FE5AE|nr:hypothetical protein [Pseudomonas sp. 18.1.10]MCR4540391.1 hypothetical protein [Pseudomonas sp. 18.1.10]
MLPLNNQPHSVVPGTSPSPTESPKTSAAAQTKSHAGFSQAPLHPQMQREILSFLQSMTPPPNLKAMRDQVPADEWKSLEGVATLELNAMLNTPMGKEMSHALQTKFDGSTFDALTWGIVGLTSQMGDSIPDRDNYSIKGFDWGAGDSSAANTFKHLKAFLVKQEQTTPEMAGAVAFLQLLKFSPASLLRDIPDYVDMSSLEWEKVSDKVDSLMLEHPLKPLGMTYSNVLNLLDPTRVEKRMNEF